MITKEKVLEALSNVQEPDLGKDLVTLNMVKDIAISGNDVKRPSPRLVQELNKGNVQPIQ